MFLLDVASLSERKIAAKKVEIADSFENLLKVYKPTHFNINGQQSQIECLRIWREIKKGKNDIETKSNAQKLTVQWKANIQKLGKSSIENYFNKQFSTTKGEHTYFIFRQ